MYDHVLWTILQLKRVYLYRLKRSLLFLACGCFKFLSGLYCLYLVGYLDFVIRGKFGVFSLFGNYCFFCLFCEWGHRFLDQFLVTSFNGFDTSKDAKFL